MQSVLVLCCDGSPSQAAVDYAARFFAGKPVTVLAVWESFIDALVHSATGAAYVPATVDVLQIDEITDKQALATASEGAERATGAGMAAETRTEQRIGSVAVTILSVAASHDPKLCRNAQTHNQRIDSSRAGHRSATRHNPRHGIKRPMPNSA